MDASDIFAALAVIVSCLTALGTFAWNRKSHAVATEAKRTADEALSLERERRNDELRPRLTVTYDHRDKRGPHGVLTIECSGPLDYDAARIDPVSNEEAQPIVGVCGLDEVPDGPFSLIRGIGPLPVGGATHLAVKKADRFDRGTLRLRITCWATDVRGDTPWFDAASVEITGPGRAMVSW